MRLKKIISALLFCCLIVTTLTVPVLGASETSMYHIDSINGTRWENYICVYQNRENTGQNQWGYNIVVSSAGVVTSKINSGDIKGKNLAIPSGGMVVSGVGDVAKEMYNSAQVGYKCLFDEYSMRVYFSKDEINPFYTESIKITGYNSTRWEDTVIIYNKSGQTTGTNVYGYEVCVDSDGYIISTGDNNNIVPTNGYVISAHGSDNIDLLKMYFTVGAKCTIKNSTVTVTYGQDQLAYTVKSELALAKEKLTTAKSQYKLIDYDTIEKTLAGIKTSNITTLEKRNAVIKQIQSLDTLFVESQSVETRSVWYLPTETSAADIKKTVAAMKEAGINELVLSASSYTGTFVPIDTNKIPFKKDSISNKLDVIQTYINECRANNISIVLWVCVFSGSFAETNSDWLTLTNKGTVHSDKFLSPANNEYRKYYMDYIKFILNKYDIDGLQLDYIRYPQFYNNIDCGYDEATIKLFEEKTGNGANVVKEIGQKLTGHSKWSTWWNFKTELVNSWVSEIYGIVKDHDPSIYVSAAVAASNSVNGYNQDPAAWVKGGYIDGIYVMSYTEEINEATTSPHINVQTDKTYLVMGCGAYLSISNQSLIQQTDNSNVYGADGTAYFEWSAVVDHGYDEIFKNSLFKNDAIPFTGDVNTVVNRLVATAKERVLLYCESVNTTKANELKNIIASLSDNDTDKATINSVISKLSATLDDNVEQYLISDLSAAIRALNLAKTDKAGSTENTENTENNENNGNNSNNEQNSESNTSDNTESNTTEDTETNIGENTESDTSNDTEINSSDKNTETDTSKDSETETESESDPNSTNNSGTNNNGNDKSNIPIVPIVIGVLVILIAAAVLIIVLKGNVLSKKSQE